MRRLIRDGEAGRDHFVVFDDCYEHATAICDGVAGGAITGAERILGKRDERDAARWFGRFDLTSWDAVKAAVVGRWERWCRVAEDLLGGLDRHRLAVPRSIRRRNSWNGDAGEFDLDRHLSGEADFWRCPARREIAGQQFVTVFVHTAATSGTRADAMMWRGLAATVAATVLEANGYSVEVTTFNTSHGTLKPRLLADGRTQVQSVTVSTLAKRMDQPVDVSALVNVLSPWYQRTLAFATYHAIPRATPAVGYGRPLTPREDDIRYVYPNSVPVPVSDVWDEASAIQAADRIVGRFAEAPDAAG